MIELILTNNCNKRCQYCDLEFKNKSLSIDDLDLFIDFISENKAKYNINFFWWEPLLEFEKIRYFLDNIKFNISNYSVWTNWILLDKEKLEFFKKNNIKIYLSIDNIDKWNKLDMDLISLYQENIVINFINDPDYLDNSIICFDEIVKYGFKKIAFMPVFSTKKWHINNLSKLKNIYNYIKNNINWISFTKYGYFNWISIEKQFVLDTDWYFYSDLDSLLWLQKQYKNISNTLKSKINDKTKLLSLKENDISLNNLINLYNINEIIRLVYDIPKQSWDFLTYNLIDKIIDNEPKKR